MGLYFFIFLSANFDVENYLEITVITYSLIRRLSFWCSRASARELKRSCLFPVKYPFALDLKVINS